MEKHIDLINTTMLNKTKHYMWGWMNMKKLLVLVVGLFMIAGVLADSEVCGDEKVVELIAGQHIDSGDVTVWNDEGNLYVKYMTEDGWEMTEAHLSVECSIEEIPQTQPNKKGKGGGNPIPGQFEFRVEYDPAVTED